MTMPNFLMIGAAKSGTTTLYEYLKSHPQVYMSDPKEPYFFAMEDKEINFHGPGDNAYAHREIINKLEEYKALFEGVQDEIAIGEASAFYLYSKQAADKIKHYIPNVKLIAVLRNPVDRAYSSYKHMMRDMREEVSSFESALSAEARRIQEGWYPIWHYTQAGFYYDNLRYYYDLFPAENIRVYLNEDLRKDPSGVAASLFEFLGVDSHYHLEAEENYNVSYIPELKALQSVRKFLLSRDSTIKNVFKPFLPEAFRQRMVQGVTSYIEKVNVKRTPMAAETRQELVELFASDIEKLETLINRDLSAWLSVRKDTMS